MPFSIYGMALSLLYNPGDYFSAHGDLIFTLLEDTKPFNATLYPDYKYVCDVYIYGFQQARLKAFPRSDDKIGVFNIGNIVRNYIYPYFAPMAASLRAQQVGENYFYVNVICRFGEEYGGTTYTNIIIDSQRSYFNHYNGRLIGQNTNLSDYLDKVLSTRPYAVSVYRNTNFHFIPFLPTDDTEINLIIKAYNGSTLAGTTTQPYTPTASSSNEMQLFNVAPTAINAAVPGFINSSIDYYTVEFNTTNITGDSIYRFNLVCEPKYEVYTVHFQNRFGGFESKDFTKVSRRKVNIEKSNFGSSAYLINASGLPEYFNAQKVYRETNKVYAGAWKESMTLNTDLLRDDEYAWLEDLIFSPICYIEIEGYFFPMTITDTNYEAKKVINDDLTNLTINIEFGDRFATQYR
jgi:hypothetical protein